MKSSILFTVLCALALGFSACSASKKLAKKPMGFEGNWEVAIKDTPAGDFNASMVIQKMDDKYVGHFTNQGSKVDLEDIRIEDRKLNSSFYSSEYGMDITIEAELQEDNNSISGWVLDSYKLTGVRKMEDNK